MDNILKQSIDWKITETSFFTIKSFASSTGLVYHEYTSHKAVGGWPLVHITIGRNPETQRRKVAKGVVAIGRIAIGVFPIGQLAIGVFPLGQLSVGLVVALGQAAFAPVAIGQLAVGLLFALGQVACAYAAIGQIAVGKYCIGQAGVGAHVWTMKVKDPAALEFFRGILAQLLSKLR